MRFKIPYLLAAVLLPACFTTGDGKKVSEPMSEIGCDCPTAPKSMPTESRAAAVSSNDHVTIRVESEPGTLLSMYSTNPVVRHIADHDILETLVRLNPNTDQPEPVLAQRWSVDEKLGVYTFELIEGVRWHDGEPLTVHDVKFTFDRLLDPAGGSVLRKYFQDVDRVTIINDHTFTIELDRSRSTFIALLSWLPILPKHIFGNDAVHSHAAARAPVGTGPYLFESWKSGRHITLTRNNEYRGDIPLIEKVIYRIVPDRRVALDLFRGGLLDIVPGVSSGRRSKFKNGQTMSFAHEEFEAWVYNTSRPIFADKATRAAVGSLIDTSTIRCSILDCLAEIVDHPWPTSFLGSTDQTIKKPGFSIKRSRQLLKDAGWIDSDGDGIRERDGVQLSFTLLLPDMERNRRRAVTLIQHDMFKAGVKVEILPVSRGTYTDRLRKHTFDASVIVVSNRPPFDPAPIFHSQGVETGRNFGMFSSVHVDNLIARLAVADSNLIRESMRKELNGVLLDEHPVTFNFRPWTRILVRDGIEGISIKEGWIFEPGIYLNRNFRRNK